MGDMPRMALKTLLRDLKASGVRRYRKEGAAVEVEFWPSIETERAAASEADPLDATSRRQVDRGRPTFRDPIATALDPPDVDDGDPEAAEASGQN